MRPSYWKYTLPLRLRSLLHHSQVEQELDEELQFHIERKIEQGLAQGLTQEEARRVALRAMDGIEQRKEECRDMRRVNVIENLFQDLRFGSRLSTNANISARIKELQTAVAERVVQCEVRKRSSTFVAAASTVPLLRYTDHN